MHVECSACGARYTIADDKIPPQGARVRCRKCQAVFPIHRAAEAPVPVELPLIPPSPQRPPAPPVRSAPPAPPVRPAQEPQTVPIRPAQESEFTRGFDHLSGFAAPAPAAHVAPATHAASAAPQAPPAPSAAAPAAHQAASAAPSPHAAPQAPPAPAAVPGADPGSGTTYAAAGIPPGLSEAERTMHERARRLARVLASDIAVYNKEKRERGIKDGNLVAILGYEIKKSWEVYKERVTPELANSTPYFRDALNEMLAEGKRIF